MKFLNAINEMLILLLLCLPLIVTSCGDDGGSIFSPSSPEVSSKVDKVTIRSKSELANTAISVGRELTLDADAYNKDGSNISLGTGFPGEGQPVSMQWSSSNSSVATIKQGGKFGNSGVLKTISPGKTEICVKASGVTDCVTITVR
jgi:hypothetical protein